MQIVKLKSLLLIALIGVVFPAFSEIKLPAIFGSNMVLQQQSEVSIWGTTNSKNKVLLTSSWNNQSYEVKPDKAGNWKMKVTTPEAGGPYRITISDGEELLLENVLIGEVWICSGQSNMEWSILKMGNKFPDGLNGVLLKSSNPEIRLFNVQNDRSLTPKNDFVGTWEETNATSLINFSATGYYFGKLLNETLGVPVGLISSNWGGTRIQAWIDEEGLKSFDPSILEDKREEVKHNTSTSLFNAMIHPMLGFKVKGVIWYQGESNMKESSIYDDLMLLMLNRWRALWDIGEFSFYYCQIAPYDYNEAGFNSAFLREAQLKASKSIPNTGMVSLMDTGEEHDIHPANKVEAGERLAYYALKETYGVEGIVCRGPELKEMVIEGDQALLTFTNDDGGLTNFGNGYHQFEIAGSDKVFYPAEASFDRKKNALVISNSKVKKPVAVRYAFKDFVVGDLYNGFGLPASSFRTDDW